MLMTSEAYRRIYSGPFAKSPESEQQRLREYFAMQPMKDCSNTLELSGEKLAIVPAGSQESSQLS